MKDIHKDGCNIFDIIENRDEKLFDKEFTEFDYYDNKFYEFMAVHSLRYDFLYGFEKAIEKVDPEKAIKFLQLPITDVPNQIEFFKVLYNKLVSGSDYIIEFIEKCKELDGIDYNLFVNR